MITNIKIEKKTNNKYLIIFYTDNISHGIYLTKKELYLLYSDLRKLGFENEQ